MKKLFAFIGIMLCFSAIAQDFPGKRVQLLKDKQLKVKPLDQALQRFGYSDFYTDEAMKKSYAVINFTKSKHDSLVGKTFKVKDITPLGKDSFDQEEYRLKLEQDNGSVLYFRYNTEYEHTFVFTVLGGYGTNADFYCGQITVSKDGGTTYYDAPPLSGVIISKTKKANVSHIYITVNENSEIVAVNKKGLVLTLANGKQIKRPEAKISVETSSGSGYLYSATFEPTAAELLLLKQSPIVKNKLYVIDGEVTDGKVLQEYIKCLAKK